jgi:hypothetical protein
MSGPDGANARGGRATNQRMFPRERTRGEGILW